MSRTPPESLIRSKLVSKSSYAVIKSLVRDPKFVAKNLENMNKASPCTFINDGGWCACKKPELMKHSPQYFILESPHSPSCGRKQPYLLTLFHEDGDGENNDSFHCVTEDFHFHLPHLLDDMDFSWTWHYHCDGIICFFRIETDTRRNTCFLCNPTIKELRPLPKLIVSGRFELKGGGLSYDSTSDDYKFVVIGLDPSFHPKSEMYSLNNDCWKEIRFDWTDLLVNYGEEDDIWIVISETFYRGSLYWIIDHSISDFSLISFNAADELFRGLPLPGDFSAFDSPGNLNPMRLTMMPRRDFGMEITIC